MGDTDNPIYLLFLVAKPSPFQATFLPLCKADHWSTEPAGPPDDALWRRPPPQHKFDIQSPVVFLRDYDLVAANADHIEVLADAWIADESTVFSDATWVPWQHFCENRPFRPEVAERSSRDTTEDLLVKTMNSGIIDKYPWLRAHFTDTMYTSTETGRDKRKKPTRIDPEMADDVDEQAVAAVLEEVRAAWEQTTTPGTSTTSR